MATRSHRRIIGCFSEEFTRTRCYCARPTFFRVFGFPVVEKSGAKRLIHPGAIMLARDTTGHCFSRRSPVKGILAFDAPSSRRGFRIANIVTSVPIHSRLRCSFLLSCDAVPGRQRSV